jgi:murein DD-endopeptidase MepM/ murein hydrolase activator NlpD
LPDGKVSLTIPPAALSADTPISVTVVGNAGSAGAVYQFGHSGLLFSQPVTVTLSVDSSLLQPGTNVQDLIPSYVDDYLEILTDVQVDSANSTITGKATHFSSIGLAKSEKVGNVSDFTKAATSFRMPIGDDGLGNDLGADLVLLDASSTWTEFSYPKRSFNMSAASNPNRWYVATAFNQDRWLNRGWEEPSPSRDRVDDIRLCKDPVQYVLSSLYSCKEPSSFHPGEDWNLLAVEDLGKPIHAIADGIVLLNQQQTGASFGNILIIGHKLVDGQVIASVYAHMEKQSTEKQSTYAVGKPVSKGAVIGTIGKSGTEAPHLHFEIARPDGVYFKADTDGMKIIIRTDSPLGIPAIQGWRWPGANTQFIEKYYYDPSKFIKDPSQFITPPPPSTFTLAVAKQGTGTGTVTSSGGGINCGTVCTSQPITGGDSVVLTAAPGSDSTFSGWSGGGCSGAGTCTVTMNTGQNVTATFNLLAPPPPSQGTWSATGSLATARYWHAATLLPNGKVRVVGGYGNSGILASAEEYDPAANGGAGAWSATGSLATARLFHTATLLPSGKVLVVGGSTSTNSGSLLASAELYDPAANGGAGAWTLAGSLTAARFWHTATVLPTGKVLVVGGSTDGVGGFLASAELFQ